jgi:hypothetical protein
VQGGENQGRHTDRHQADDLLPAGQHREDAGQVSNGLLCSIEIVIKLVIFFQLDNIEKMLDK